MSELINTTEVNGDVQKFIPLAMAGIFTYNMITKYPKLIPVMAVGFLFWKNSQKGV